MAAVHQHGEPYRGGAADGAQRVERGTDGAPGVEHVVDQDDGPPVDPGARDPGGARGAGGIAAQIVAVHRDVERAVEVGEVLPLGAALGARDLLGQAAGERHAAMRDSEQDQVLGAVAALEDLVGDARQRPPDLVGAQHAGAACGRGGGLGRGL